MDTREAEAAIACSLEAGRAAWWFVALITSNGRFHVLRLGEDYWLLDSLHGEKRRLEFEWTALEGRELPAFSDAHVFTLRFVAADRVVALVRAPGRVFAVLLAASVREARLRALDALPVPAAACVLRAAEEAGAVVCFHFRKQRRVFDGSLLTADGGRLEGGRRVDLLAGLPLDFRMVVEGRVFGFDGDRRAGPNPRKLFECSLRSGRSRTHPIAVDKAAAQWIERASQCVWLGRLFVALAEKTAGHWRVFTFDLRAREWRRAADLRVRGLVVQTVAAADHSLVLRSREQVGGLVLHHFFRLHLRQPSSLLEAAWTVARSSDALARLPADSKLRCPWRKRPHDADDPELLPGAAKATRRC
ncbi:hypothetical protein M3Y99_01651600 [Aphelenchoides fujianensis]|nr:hypothetical protein M3Y99_01651600 [Aphelenchoides fujianensis]